MTIKDLLKTVINIKDKKYYPSKKRPKLGKYVLDKKDGTFGIMDQFQGKYHIAIKDGWIAEVGVPIKRVYSLHLKRKQS